MFSTGDFLPAAGSSAVAPANILKLAGYAGSQAPLAFASLNKINALRANLISHQYASSLE
jgi:hypothetical protein